VASWKETVERLNWQLREAMDEKASLKDIAPEMKRSSLR